MPVIISKNLPVLMAMDVSAHTGLVVMDKEGTVLHKEDIDLSSIKNPNSLQQRLGRMKRLFLYTLDSIKRYNPACAVIEGYITHGKFVQFQQYELGAVVRSAFYNRDIPIWEISPTSLKKSTTDAGNAKKDQMRLACYKRWNFEDKSDNVVDAYALARLGLCLQKWAEPATTPEREVVHKLLQGHEDAEPA